MRGVRRFTTPLILLVLCAATSGCTVEQSEDGESSPCARGSDPTRGELGRAKFSHFTGVLGCLFGCGGVKEPIAERARHDVLVLNRGDLPPFVARSATPEIATFSYPGDVDNIHVETLAPGTAVLELHDAATDELIDQVRLTVAPVARIEIDDVDPSRPVLVVVGGKVELDVSPLGENGCELYGIGGVDYELEGGLSESNITLVDALTDALVAGLVGYQESVRITATTVGSGQLTVSAPSGATLGVPLSVVTEQAVEVVELSAEGKPTVGAEYGVKASTTTAAGDRVYGASCDWALTPPDGPVQISGQSALSATLLASEPASAELACTVGAATGRLTADFQ